MLPYKSFAYLFIVGVLFSACAGPKAPYEDIPKMPILVKPIPVTDQKPASNEQSQAQTTTKEKDIKESPPSGIMIPIKEPQAPTENQNTHSENISSPEPIDIGQKPLAWYIDAKNLTDSFADAVHQSDSSNQNVLSRIYKNIQQYQASELHDLKLVAALEESIHEKGINLPRELSKRIDRQANVRYAKKALHYVDTGLLTHRVMLAVSTLEVIAKELREEITLKNLERFSSIITTHYHSNQAEWEIIHGELSSINLE